MDTLARWCLEAGYGITPETITQAGGVVSHGDYRTMVSTIMDGTADAMAMILYMDRTRTQLAPIEEAGLQNALVIVYAERWLEYGAMLAGMSPMLDDKIVYARGGGTELDSAVIGEFAGRTVYYLQDGRLTRAPQGY